MNSRSLLTTALFAAVLGLASQAHAGVVSVSSSAALPTNDTITWGQLGASNYSGFASPVSVTSGGGLNATVTDGQTLARLDEGLGWIGQFPNGDQLLWNAGDYQSPTPITIDFATSIYGAGALIQADDYGPFTATVSIYDSTDTLLGSFNFNGDSTDAPGTALFAGAVSSAADVSSIVFSVDTGGGNFAIDTLDLNTNGAGAGVPDTSATLALLALAVAGLFAYRMRLAGSAA